MREKLISFLPDQFPEPDAFFVELTGVTYPDPRYRIDRDRSLYEPVTVDDLAAAGIPTEKFCKKTVGSS